MSHGTLRHNVRCHATPAKSMTSSDRDLGAQCQRQRTSFTALLCWFCGAAEPEKQNMFQTTQPSHVLSCKHFELKTDPTRAQTIRTVATARVGSCSNISASGQGTKLSVSVYSKYPGTCNDHLQPAPAASTHGAVFY